MKNNHPLKTTLTTLAALAAWSFLPAVAQEEETAATAQSEQPASNVPVAQTAEDAVKEVEAFFNQVQTGAVLDAYKALMANSPINRKEADVMKLVEQTQGGMNLYGESLGYEKIAQEMYGSSVLRLIYIQKLEGHPLFWEFYYYKKEAGLILYNVRFNDTWETLNSVDPS